MPGRSASTSFTPVTSQISCSRCDLAEPVGRRPGYRDRFAASSPNAALARGSRPAGQRLRPGGRRVRGDERLGKDEQRAPSPAPPPAIASSLSIVRSRSRMTGSAWTHATFTGPSTAAIVSSGAGQRDKRAVDHDEALARERLDRLRVELCELRGPAAATSRSVPRGAGETSLRTGSASEAGSYARPREGHRSASGHAPHRGTRARQTVAPRSISACAALVVERPAVRSTTRRTLTSTGSTGRPNANARAQPRCSARRPAARSGPRASRSRRPPAQPGAG